MSEAHTGGGSGRAMRHDRDTAAALDAADWLCLAAAPTFAIMALLTFVLGGGAMDMRSAAMTDASPLRHDPDVRADERLPLRALAEVDLQPAQAVGTLGASIELWQDRDGEAEGSDRKCDGRHYSRFSLAPSLRLAPRAQRKKR